MGKLWVLGFCESDDRARILSVMRDRDLYSQILGISSPWKVIDVQLDLGAQQVLVRVALDDDAAVSCPACRRGVPRYDSRERRWRHLDTCQLQTILVADVPRVECPEHSVKQIAVPWAEPRSRFTALFEAVVIDWLKEAPILAVSRRLGLTWHEVDGIMLRAVVRGLARRAVKAPKRLGVDETAFQKRHEYVTVVTDLDSSTVLYVADDRKAESLTKYYKSLSPAQRRWIAIVAMDMHQPYVRATREFLPDAENKIAFDKFHVAQHLGEGVDRVRRAEHRELMAKDDWTLKGSKHMWLQNPDNMDEDIWNSAFAILKTMNLKTARAWRLKEAAMWIWERVQAKGLAGAWKRWFGWAARSRLEPMKAVAAMIKNHLRGIMNAILSGATNAASESINAKIQKIKRLACGFRNRGRFKQAIYFHLSGLDLYPASAGITHTKP